MKRISRWIVLVTMLMLVAGSVPGTVAAQAQSGLKVNITFGSGTAGGTMWPITEGVAELIRKEYPGSNVTVTTGQDGSNQIRTGLGQLELGICYIAGAALARAGEYPYDMAYPKIKAVCNLYNSIVHFAVTTKSGITSFDQIREEKYPLKLNCMAPKGSIQEISARTILAGYGITYEDIESWGGKVSFIADNTEVVELTRNGQLDAVSTLSNIPTRYIVEIASFMDMNILEVKDEVIEKAAEKLGAAKYTIPAGTYPFLKKDVNTITLPVALITHDGVSEDVVYAITRSIELNTDYLANLEHVLKGLTPERLARVAPLPLHPGAEKYYKEVGALPTN